MRTYQKRYQRSAAILNHKYCIYMIPALLSAVGVSLSEFADSLIVGRLLSENAFAIVNLGIPIVFMAATIYTTTGLGGSLLYAEYLAKKEKDRADACFTASVIASLGAGLILFIALMLFRTRLAASATGENAEVMEDLESRISELFMQELGDESRVVSLSLVERVTGQLGMPDGGPEKPQAAESAGPEPDPAIRKKIYRDYDNKRIAGVCAGLAVYLDIDVVLARVLMLVALVAGTAGFWIYVICWIAIPKAVTPTQKCEMHGVPVTAENIAAYSKKK